VSVLEDYIRNELSNKLGAMGVSGFYFTAKDPDDHTVHYLRCSNMEWIYGVLSRDLRELEYIWEMSVEDKFGGNE